MAKRAAIILSGGRAERFQNTQEMWQDKALVELLGKPLLIRAVENVREVVEEVIICVNNEKRKAQYAEVLKKHSAKNIRLLIDEPCNQLGGPIVGILTGLVATKADYCFTLPSDMPLLQPKVIDHMFNSAKDTRVVVPMWPNGRLETLTMVLKKPEVLEITKTLCMLGRPRSDDIIRGALNVLLISTVNEIRTFDPELKSFININSQADLTRLQPRQAQGPVTESLRLNLGDLPMPELRHLQTAAALFNESKFLEASQAFSSCATRLEKEESCFWAAISRENEGKSLLSGSKQQSKQELATEQAVRGKKALLKAAGTYGCEAEIYENAHGIFLAERARSNKEWCESLANDQTGQSNLLPLGHR
ncbi:molybdenum cofactor guanylyltransferase [Candidatus Bathyarchaeota archaeon]|nr:molybdenum cofactor guanylyltransferase [Candidatus Bathyarchaeota archaeon]